MNYIIIEAQTDNGQTAVVNPIPVYSDHVEAEAVFLEKCAYARRSGLQRHSVILLTDDGKTKALKSFVANQ